MGAERDDGFALPIVLLDERIDRHWHVAPPVRITDEDDVVILYLYIPFDDRTRLDIQFPFGYFRTFRIIIGIRRYRLDVEEVAIRFDGYHFGKDVGVAFLNVSYGIILACP